MGIVEGLAKKETGWETCLPKGWESANVSDDSSVSPIDNKLASMNGAMGLIKDLVGFALKAACAAKKAVSDFISKIINKALGKGRKTMRFMQKSDAIRALTEAERNVVEDMANKVWNFIKAKANEIATKVKDFFSGDYMTKITTFIGCVKSAVTAGKNIAAVVQGFITKVNTITAAAGTGPGLVVPVVNLIIDLVCNYDQFKTAVDDLIKAVGEKSDKPKRYNYIGRFIGGLINAVGTA